jgi:hypothetical protein
MSRTRALRSVTQNFLSTYSSRYSDRQGYWLFGFLSEVPLLEIDLLGDRYRRCDAPEEDARLLAMDAFVGQLAKARLSESRLAHARLIVTTSPRRTMRIAGGPLRQGRAMTFAVTVTTIGGTDYQASCTKFVAPHDPAVELRSRRAEGVSPKE